MEQLKLEEEKKKQEQLQRDRQEQYQKQVISCCTLINLSLQFEKRHINIKRNDTFFLTLSLLGYSCLIWIEGRGRGRKHMILP